MGGIIRGSNSHNSCKLYIAWMICSVVKLPLAASLRVVVYVCVFGGGGIIRGSNSHNSCRLYIAWLICSVVKLPLAASLRVVVRVGGGGGGWYN